MTNTLLRCAFLAALAAGLAVSASAGELKLTMQDGRVTIIAVDVPLRQILQEWSRVGQTKIVNADKLSGPTMSLQLIDAPEREALDILLRSASGYIAAPRPVQIAGAAIYDRVTIMATSRAPAMTAASQVPPTFQRPPTPNDDTDEPINLTMPPPSGARPVTGQYPGMLGPNGPIGPNGQVIQMGPNGQPIQMGPNGQAIQMGPNGPLGPNGQPLMGQPTQAVPMTAPRPGAIPNQLPNGPGNPYQQIPPKGPGGGPGGV